MRIPASVLLLLTALPLRITAQVPASAANVRITEVNYHPHDLTAAELASPNAPVDPDGFEFTALDDLKAQAKSISDNLKQTGAPVEADREIIALIAYLQRLGTDIKAASQGGAP